MKQDKYYEEDKEISKQLDKKSKEFLKELNDTAASDRPKKKKKLTIEELRLSLLIFNSKNEQITKIREFLQQIYDEIESKRETNVDIEAKANDVLEDNLVEYVRLDWADIIFRRYTE